MSNIINHNFSDFKIKINRDEYYDYFINSDTVSYTNCYDGLITCIDMGYDGTKNDEWLNGDEKYIWNDSINKNITLNNIGYTGIDNGLIKYRKDLITNSQFYKIYTSSEYKLGNSKTLKLHKVSGTHNMYDYPITLLNDKIKFNGGFYQGFFKTKCDEYQVLPSNFESGDVINFEFVLNKQDFEKESNKTLNDTHKNNKGIFFYIGTKSENKWDYLYNEDDECFSLSIDNYVDDSEIDKNTHILNNFNDNDLYTDDYSDETSSFFGDDYLIGEIDDCIFDYVENEIDISDIEYETNDGFTLSLNNQQYFDTDNKFILFDRTKDGFNIKNWEDNTKVRFTFHKSIFDGNLFLLMDRTQGGFNVKNIDEYRNSFKEKYNVNNDLYNNALCFRITDDGEIGYRYLIKDENCELKVVEGYSNKNIIKDGDWYTLNVELRFKVNTMVLYFYVNGYLIYVTNELPKLQLRPLNDIYSKQETVPYNISLGGGTQGLCETVLPNYMLEPYRTYPLEKYFAGSFIGYIKEFKIYDKMLSAETMKHNSKNNQIKIKNIA